MGYGGGNFFPIHKTEAVIGSKNLDTNVRTSVALAATFDGSTQKAFEVGSMPNLTIDILYTMGATETSNSIEIRLEASPDGANFYRLANEAVVGGTSTLTAREFTFVGVNAAAATIQIFIDIAYKFMRIEAKETGVVTNAGTVYAEVTLSGR